MQASVILLCALICVVSPTVGSTVRSFGSCFGSGPESQICGNQNFWCPVDRVCKSRSLRCTGTNVCLDPSSGIEENCGSRSNGGYTIKLGRTSLFSRKRLEFNHQFISYRGFVYEFGCGYGVQILDLNDPDYKYKYTSVDFEVKGASQCTYDQTLHYTDSWTTKYSLFNNNCQHFANLFSEYLLTARCDSSKRETADLDEFADSLIANCTECCDPVTENMANAVTPFIWLVPFLSLFHLIEFFG